MVEKNKDDKKIVEGVDQERPTELTGDVNMHQAMIAEAAYYKAEKRGFAPGYEMEDWLEAEGGMSRPD